MLRVYQNEPALSYGERHFGVKGQDKPIRVRSFGKKYPGEAGIWVSLVVQMVDFAHGVKFLLHDLTTCPLCVSSHNEVEVKSASIVPGEPADMLLLADVKYLLKIFVWISTLISIRNSHELGHQSAYA